MQDTKAQDHPVALAAHLGAALRDAGPIALRSYRNANIKSWTKGKDSPVSEADIAVDQFLRERLTREGYGWLSEESVDDRARLSSRRLFIVDPIDGTRSFLAGRSDWSIVAAVVEDGRPLAAAIYAPVEDELFLASAGHGATRNGEPIAATDGGSISDARIAGPKSFLERLSEFDRGTVHIPKIYSLALRMTRVAEGRIDGAMASVNASDWDLAAADLLVHEAGGVLTDFAGKRLVYNLHDPVHGAIVAAGRSRHALLLDLVQNRREQFV